MEYLEELIIGFGYVGIASAIFAESGVLIGAILPGDSLLFTLGLLASQDIFDIRILYPLTIIAAILGDTFGYTFGKIVGKKIFSREENLIFKKSYITKTERFYARYGKKTIILARFVPIVRTFAPILAGVGLMHYPTFLSYNIIGGIGWVTLILGAGYILGEAIPGIEHYIELIIIGIIALSLLPLLFETIKIHRESREGSSENA